MRLTVKSRNSLKTILNADKNMKTKTIKINSERPERGKIKEVVRILNSGGIVAYPTDTCYGLGVGVTNVKAIMKLRKLKQRPLIKPISMIVSSLSMAEKYCVITPQIKLLVKKFMPGPLTIVTYKKPTVPDVLNKKEVSFRIPNNRVALAIVRSLKVPITSPSANPKNLKPAYSAEEVLHYFDGKIDAVIDVGKLPKVKPSTVIDMKSTSPKLIRKGPISLTRIRKVLNESGF